MKLEDKSNSRISKFGKGIPRHLEKGAQSTQSGGRDTKEALLARMKAAALAKAEKKAD